MALYAIADLHLSLGTDKPMDVFRGWENYVERLEKNWRALVTEEDTVVIAGDISWGMRLEETGKDFAFGQKAIVKRQPRLLVVHAQQDRDILCAKGLQNDAARVQLRRACGGHYGLRHARLAL